MMIHSIFLAAIVLAFFSSCRERQEATALAGRAEYEQLQWVQKAARALSHNEALSAETATKLAQIPREEAVEFLVKQPLFVKSLYRFHEYYLAYPTLEDEMLDFPGTVAVDAIANGGDIFRLWNDVHPRFEYIREVITPRPLFDEFSSKPVEPRVRDLSPEQVRKELRIMAADHFQAALRKIDEKKSNDNLFCDQVEFSYATKYSSYSRNTANEERYRFLDLCLQAGVARQELKSALESYYNASLRILDGLDQATQWAKAHEKDITFKVVELTQFIPHLNDTYYAGAEISTNTSTNMNLKRAAYALKVFFCDDLSLAEPVKVDAAAVAHGSDRHGSEPQCQTCHYKLEPMSGFYRQLDGSGRLAFQSSMSLEGKVFAKLRKINNPLERPPPPPAFNFSNPVSLDYGGYQKYLQKWVDTSYPSGYRAGFIRSARNRKKNNYEQDPNKSIAELMGIVRLAPEAAHCYVRRLAV